MDRVFFGRELDADPAGYRHDGVILVDGVTEFLEVFRVTLPLQGALADIDLATLLEENHPQGRCEHSHLFFAAGFAHRHALVAAQDEKAAHILDLLDDLFDRFLVGHNHWLLLLFNSAPQTRDLSDGR